MCYSSCKAQPYLSIGGLTLYGSKPNQYHVSPKQLVDICLHIGQVGLKIEYPVVNGQARHMEILWTSAMARVSFSSKAQNSWALITMNLPQPRGHEAVPRGHKPWWRKAQGGAP